MKNTSFVHSMNFKCGLAFGAMGLLVSCAHSLRPVKIASSANPTEEIAYQKDLIAEARSHQVDVLASNDFEEARDYLNEAAKDHKDGDASNEVLETLGYSKAHLEKALKTASSVRTNISEVTTAREAAINGGARSYQSELDKLDNKMKDLATMKPEKVEPAEKLALQTEYIKLELKSIKYHKLNKVQDLLTKAKDKDASSITPKAYGLALQKYNIAEKTIETDRHDESKINPAVKQASLSASRVLKLLESEQTSRNQSPEQRAVGIEARELALKRADKINTAVEAESDLKDYQLAKQGEKLAVSRSENKDLRRRENDEMIVEQAAAQFSKNEADVYRQEDLLIIRLKTMKFASGRSDLPSDSIAVLTKVKDVIKQLGPSSVTVEGHTDAVGESALNQKLSEKRAESVVKFFNTDELLNNNSMDSVGYGSTKPLTSNKTQVGRAQNRRVDIVIKPNQSI